MNYLIKAKSVARTIPFLLFGSLFIFEILNYVGVLSYPIDFTWRGRVLSTSILFLLAFILDWFIKKNTDVRWRSVIWFFACVLILLDFSGDVFHFYGRWDWYDQLVHFSSGSIITAALYLFFQSIRVRTGWRVPGWSSCFLAFTTNVTFASLYEIEEYLEDFFYYTNRLGDGPDTANDLMLNIIAGLFTMVFILIYQTHLQGKRERQDGEQYEANA